VSKTLQIALAWSQWQSGISRLILDDTSTPLDHVESHWIPSLRDSLRTFQVFFELDHTFVPQPERQGDLYIMEAATQSRRFSKQDLNCRLYLHVTTTSELFDADRLNVLPHMLRSLLQLQTYLTAYTPVIMASIRAADSQLDRPFRWLTMSTTPQSSIAQPTGHSAWEEAPHRKRNRLRIRVLQILWIIQNRRRSIYIPKIPLVFPVFLLHSFPGVFTSPCGLVDIPDSAWCSCVDCCAVNQNRLYQLWLTHLTRTNRQRKLDFIFLIK
jgi:hypothetical protein